jgi:hypothetical protein
MSIARSNLIPNEVSFFTRKSLGRSGIINRLCFCPNADIRFLSLYPTDEGIIIIILPAPHSILDIPVENLEVLAACLS